MHAGQAAPDGAVAPGPGRAVSAARKYGRGRSSAVTRSASGAAFRQRSSRSMTPLTRSKPEGPQVAREVPAFGLCQAPVSRTRAGPLACLASPPPGPGRPARLGTPGRSLPAYWEHLPPYLELDGVNALLPGNDSDVRISRGTSSGVRANMRKGRAPDIRASGSPRPLCEERRDV